MPNEEQNFVEIDGERFELIDEIDNIPIVDSFVKKNKIANGHGEARLYVGPQGRRDFDQFFNNFHDTCLFLKRDLEGYLNDAKFEYEQQEQGYQEDISNDWHEYNLRLQSLSSRVEFSIEKAVGEQDVARYYIRSQDEIFREYFRSIMLPVISYVSILKLKGVSNNFLFLFRPLLSYSFNPYYHPARERQVEEEIAREPLSTLEKEQLVMARVGQGQYRQRLLNESSECVITRVNDERILTASHIKPWSISSDQEKIDHNNGLVLTPTYDKLFDQGFISFNNDGTVLISPYISPLNVRKLNLVQGRRYVIPLTDRRREYLAYHREYIYKR